VVAHPEPEKRIEQTEQNFSKLIVNGVRRNELYLIELPAYKPRRWLLLMYAS